MDSLFPANATADSVQETLEPVSSYELVGLIRSQEASPSASIFAKIAPIRN
jgi:hypothetical protein